MVASQSENSRTGEGNSAGLYGALGNRLVTGEQNLALKCCVSNPVDIGQSLGRDRSVSLTHTDDLPPSRPQGVRNVMVSKTAVCEEPQLCHRGAYAAARTRLETVDDGRSKSDATSSIVSPAEIRLMMSSTLTP